MGNDMCEIFLMAEGDIGTVLQWVVVSGMCAGV